MGSGLPQALNAVLTVSIVSHGHDRWLPSLLQDLADTSHGRIARVVLTHNLPPMPATALGRSWPFQLTQITNPSPRGFGANHNTAFQQARSAPYFCVLNPDIRLTDSTVWNGLIDAAGMPGTGLAFPALVNDDGSRQDNLRATPTPWALFRRRVLRQPERSADWASAAFWLMASGVFERLHGFDERYFLYCEDTDFCLRLQLQGYRLQAAPVQAVHSAQRQSHTRPDHLALHLRSLLRLWSRPVMWRFLLRRHTNAPALPPAV